MCNVNGELRRGGLLTGGSRLGAINLCQRRRSVEKRDPSGRKERKKPPSWRKMNQILSVEGFGKRRCVIG